MRRPLIALGLIAAILSPTAIAVADTELKEGRDYHVVGQTRSETPQVIEFYAYGCPHCRTLDPQVERWVTANLDVGGIQRIPVVFGLPQWQRFSEAYYIGEVLGRREETHQALFELAHQKGQLNSEEDLVAFFAELGVEKEQALGAQKSFFVQSRLRQGEVLVRQHRIMGIPSFVVNGKYKTDAAMLGSFDKVDAALTELLHKPN